MHVCFTPQVTRLQAADPPRVRTHTRRIFTTQVNRNASTKLQRCKLKSISASWKWYKDLKQCSATEWGTSKSKVKTLDGWKEMKRWQRPEKRKPGIEKISSARSQFERFVGGPGFGLPFLSFKSHSVASRKCPLLSRKVDCLPC
jgi:hypothetical protein